MTELSDLRARRLARVAQVLEKEGWNPSQSPARLASEFGVSERQVFRYKAEVEQRVCKRLQRAATIRARLLKYGNTPEVEVTLAGEFGMMPWDVRELIAEVQRDIDNQKDQPFDRDAAIRSFFFDLDRFTQAAHSQGHHGAVSSMMSTKRHALGIGVHNELEAPAPPPREDPLAEIGDGMLDKLAEIEEKRANGVALLPSEQQGLRLLGVGDAIDATFTVEGEGDE